MNREWCKSDNIFEKGLAFFFHPRVVRTSHVCSKLTTTIYHIITIIIVNALYKNNNNVAIKAYGTAAGIWSVVDYLV